MKRLKEPDTKARSARDPKERMKRQEKRMSERGELAEQIMGTIPSKPSKKFKCIIILS